MPRRWSGVAVSAILALLWAWIGLAYHLTFFTSIGPPAYAFAAISFAGAAVFFWQGVVRRRLEFRWVLSVRALAGLGLIVFALLVYPLWAWLAGHRYPAFATFSSHVSLRMRPTLRFIPWRTQFWKSQRFEPLRFTPCSA